MSTIARIVSQKPEAIPASLFRVRYLQELSDTHGLQSVDHIACRSTIKRCAQTSEMGIAQCSHAVPRVRILLLYRRYYYDSARHGVSASIRPANAGIVNARLIAGTHCSRFLTRMTEKSNFKKGATGKIVKSSDERLG